MASNLLGPSSLDSLQQAEIGMIACIPHCAAKFDNGTNVRDEDEAHELRGATQGELEYIIRHPSSLPSGAGNVLMELQ